MKSIFTTCLETYLKEHDENGRTFSDICREAPFPKGTLGTLTSGRVDNPTYNTAYKLAQALWVPMEAFAVRTKAEREKYCKSIRHEFKTEQMLARETVTAKVCITSNGKSFHMEPHFLRGHYGDEDFYFSLTFDTIDGKPDPASINIEKITQ